MHPNDQEASIYTAHEVDRQGQLERIFHRTDSGSSWTHPVGQTYRYWTELGPERRKTEGSHGWVQTHCDCPVVRPVEGQASTSEADEIPERPADPGSASSTSDQKSGRRT